MGAPDSAKVLSVEDLITQLFQKRKVNIALTGGGGKTTFLGVLGRAFASRGTPVLLTTTTKVQNPFPIEVDRFFVSTDAKELKGLVLGAWRPGILGMAVARPYGDHKWEGVSSEWIDELFSTVREGAILNEADGAFRLPIKAPASHEPVIPASTTHVLPVLGLTAIGAPLDEAHAFRPRLIADITGLALGEPMDEAALARLILHPRGLAKDAPQDAEIVPFLNQADDGRRREMGYRIAERVLSASLSVKTVLIGTLNPFVRFEIVKRT